MDDYTKNAALELIEKEMIRWHKEHFANKRDWEKTSGEYLTRKSQLDIAYHFTEWQKQQMMKNAVEGLSCTYSNKEGTFLHIKQGIDTKDGDKIKIIIIKSE